MEIHSLDLVDERLLEMLWGLMNAGERLASAIRSGTLPFFATARCGDDVAAAGPLTEGGTASESAGES